MSGRTDWRCFEEGSSRRGEICQRGRQRLRNREREHRHKRCGNWRRVRWREKYRRRARERQRLLEELHAPPNEHGQFLQRASIGTGNPIRRRRRRQRDGLKRNYATPHLSSSPLVKGRGEGEESILSSPSSLS